MDETGSWAGRRTVTHSLSQTPGAVALEMIGLGCVQGLPTPPQPPHPRVSDPTLSPALSLCVCVPHRYPLPRHMLCYRALPTGDLRVPPPPGAVMGQQGPEAGPGLPCDRGPPLSPAGDTAQTPERSLHLLITPSSSSQAGPC